MSSTWLISKATFGIESSEQPSVAEYLRSLIAPAIPPPKRLEGETEQLPDVTKDDGRLNSCTTTRYSLQTNADKIVTLDPDRETLWPGALIQGRGYQLGIGSIRELPIKKRAPIQLSVSLLTRENTLEVESPSSSSVNSAVGNLIEPLADTNKDFGSSISFTQTETYTLDQSLMSVGLSAKYAGAEFRAKHSEGTTTESNVVSVVFIQNAFTVFVDTPSTPSALFTDDLTIEDLLEQAELDRIGPNNVPVMLQSVTYGRILYATISSSKSMSEIKSALDASYKSSAASAAASLSEDQKRVLTESKMTISGIGIEIANAQDMIVSGKVQEFFANTMNLRSVRPISYVFRNLNDLSIAGLAEATDYAVTVCQPKAISPSERITTLGASYVAQLGQLVSGIHAAWSNRNDDGGRLGRLREAEAAQVAGLNTLEEMKKFLPDASADDKQWTRDWAGTQITALENHASNFQLGVDRNPDDDVTRSVWAAGLVLMPSLRNNLNSVASVAQS